MENIKINGDWISIFTVCQAYSQLESDYNQDGWLRERPSNQRRMESIGCQLHRLKYSNPYGWTEITAEPGENDDGDDEAVRFIYFSKVLEWDLPIDQDQAATIRRIFVDDFLAPYQYRLDAAEQLGYYRPSGESVTQAPQPG